MIRGAQYNYGSHAPHYDPEDETHCEGIGCQCKGPPDRYVGFCHYHTCIRNLNHPDESEEHKKYKHCLGIVWSGDTTNLLDFCDSAGLDDLGDRVTWEINGAPQTEHELKIGKEPADLDPKIFWVKMLDKGSGMEWDRCVFVVCNRETKESFKKWYDRFSVETAWLAELPAAYSALAAPTTNWIGWVSRDPEPGAPNLWKAPDEPGKYMHHTAKWQMRSETTQGKHGHQACYDTNGVIITKGVSAGTADFGSTRKDFNLGVHVAEDVNPFLRALQLDGNPCRRSYKSLDHALIHEGDNIEKYIECRPAIPNSKPLLPPEQVP
jgi:hypothetical protein